MSQPFFGRPLSVAPQGTPDAVELPGGVIRVSTSSPTFQKPPPVSTTRATFADQGAEEVRGKVLTQYVVGRDDPPAASIMQSLRRDGPFQTVEIEPGNPASRTRVEVAEKLGLIRPIGPGIWANMGPAVAPVEALSGPAVDPSLAPEVATPGSGALDAESETLWAEDIADIPQPIYDAAVTRTTDAVVAGGDLAAVAQQLAKDGGMEPALAMAYVSEGAAMYQDAADAAMEREGITGADLGAFYGHLRANKAPEMKHAIQRLTMANDMSVFRKLATEYQMSKRRR